MPFNLSSVEDYIADARTLLLDRLPPFRYGDPSLIVALNLSLQETYRLRPDLFRRGHVPAYDAISSDDVPIEPQFRRAVVYGLAGHALMRDEEDVQDARATMFLSQQEYLLTGKLARPPVQGGTPAPGNAQR